MQVLTASQRNEEGRNDSFGHDLIRATTGTRGNWAATRGCDPPGGKPTTSATSGSGSGTTNGTKTRAGMMMNGLAARRIAVSGRQEARLRSAPRIGAGTNRSAGSRQRLRERTGHGHEQQEEETCAA